MVFIGHYPKLTSKNLDSGNGKTRVFEVCGVVLSQSSSVVRVCDFHGEIQIFKPSTLSLDNCSYVFRLRRFHRNKVPALYCISARKASIYEEIVFNVECSSLPPI
jgi:hypothetical protein